MDSINSADGSSSLQRLMYTLKLQQQNDTAPAADSKTAAAPAIDADNALTGGGVNLNSDVMAVLVQGQDDGAAVQKAGGGHHHHHHGGPPPTADATDPANPTDPLAQLFGSDTDATADGSADTGASISNTENFLKGIRSYLSAQNTQADPSSQLTSLLT